MPRRYPLLSGFGVSSPPVHRRCGYWVCGARVLRASCSGWPHIGLSARGTLASPRAVLDLRASGPRRPRVSHPGGGAPGALVKRWPGSHKAGRLSRGMRACSLACMTARRRILPGRDGAT